MLENNIGLVFCYVNKALESSLKTATLSDGDTDWTGGTRGIKTESYRTNGQYHTTYTPETFESPTKLSIKLNRDISKCRVIKFFLSLSIN